MTNPRPGAVLWKSGQLCFTDLLVTGPELSVMHAPLTPRPNDSRLLAAVVGGLSFLLLAVLASIIASVASSEADHSAAHSLMVREASGHLFSLLQDAETGQRGFLLTSNDGYRVDSNLGNCRARLSWQKREMP